jgi:hypothetical protein
MGNSEQQRVPPRNLFRSLLPHCSMVGPAGQTGHLLAPRDHTDAQFAGRGYPQGENS